MPVLQLTTALPHTVLTHRRLMKHTPAGPLFPLGLCVSCEVVHLGLYLTLCSGFTTRGACSTSFNFMTRLTRVVATPSSGSVSSTGSNYNTQCCHDLHRAQRFSAPLLCVVKFQLKKRIKRHKVYITYLHTLLRSDSKCHRLMQYNLK